MVGCLLQWTANRECVVPTRTPPSYQMPRANGRTFCKKILLQKRNVNSAKVTNGQHKSHSIYKQSGRPFPNSSQLRYRHMAVVPSNGNLPLCTTHPRYPKFNSSPRIQGTQGFFRSEANLICVLPTRQSVGSHTDGPICNPSHKSTSGICKLETKHRSGSDRRFLSRLASIEGICIPSVQLS